jgi:hypothetical protein
MHPRRAFTYAIDGRAQQLLAQLGLLEQVQARGVDLRGVATTVVGPDGELREDPLDLTRVVERQEVGRRVAG